MMLTRRAPISVAQIPDLVGHDNTVPGGLPRAVPGSRVMRLTGAMPTDDDVRDAYARRAGEYADLLGSVDAMSPVDRDRIAAWGASVRGPVLDVGCGPGHWTAFLHDAGVDVRGIDPVPRFITHARTAFPGIDVSLGSVLDIEADDASHGGVLAWYSLIHLEPPRLMPALREIARVLRPRGTVLIGFFEGSELASFDHAVVRAFFWPVERLREALGSAGLEVFDVETRQDAGARPHASIIACRV